MTGPHPDELPPGDWALPMSLALGEARSALATGDVPVGAVVLDEGGQLIATGRNLREATEDPTAHAEIVALRAGSLARGRWRLDGCTLVVTLEPCVMCAGALVQARIATLVYGADDPKAGAAGSVWDLVRDPRLNHRPGVVAGIQAESSTQLLKAFFAARRQSRG